MVPGDLLLDYHMLPAHCECSTVSVCVCVYIGWQLGVGPQSGPDLRLEATVREDLSDQAEFTGLNCRQLLVEQQHLTGLEGASLVQTTLILSHFTTIRHNDTN